MISTSIHPDISKLPFLEGFGKTPFVLQKVVSQETSLRPSPSLDMLEEVVAKDVGTDGREIEPEHGIVVLPVVFYMIAGALL